MTARTAIESIGRELADSINSKKAAGVSKLYTKDACLFPPGAPRQDGRKAIQAFWQAATDMGLSNVVLTTVEVEEFGNSATEVGTVTATLPGNGDTSALLDGWTRYYPPDVLPTLWDRTAGLIDASSLVAHEEVYLELEKKADDLFDWVNDHRNLIVEMDDEHQQRVREILERWPRLVDSKKNRSGADPFVIALAGQRGFRVVTGEKPSGNLNKPMIPDVCEAMGIQSMTFLELIREQGWRF
jgi:ketosteroid isomerase-like protein